MSTAVYKRIRKNPKFDELVAKRSRFAWTLTACVRGRTFKNVELTKDFVHGGILHPEILASSGRVRRKRAD